MQRVRTVMPPMTEPMMASLSVETEGFAWLAGMNGALGLVDDGMKAIAGPGPQKGVSIGAGVDCA